jgi:mono/diheme cytochrome c family protein
MSRNRFQVSSRRFQFGKLTALGLLLIAYCLFASGCRYDMQDQPKYKYYAESDFFPDKRASRDLPNGTVPRGWLHENKAFWTGKVDNPNPNAPVQTTTDASGNTLVASFPNDIDYFPVPVTKALIDRGQDRFNIYCIVCHGPEGQADGMLVRRGFPKPPTYHDDRLRNAPVGHFFDVMTNGWGKMNSYAAQVSPADRWAIAAYIRTLQIAQDPDMNLKMAGNANAANANTSTAKPPASPSSANTSGGANR